MSQRDEGDDEKHVEQSDGGDECEEAEEALS